MRIGVTHPLMPPDQVKNKAWVFKFAPFLLKILFSCMKDNLKISRG